MKTVSAREFYSWITFVFLVLLDLLLPDDGSGIFDYIRAVFLFAALAFAIYKLSQAGTGDSSSRNEAAKEEARR